MSFLLSLNAKVSFVLICIWGGKALIECSLQNLYSASNFGLLGRKSLLHANMNQINCQTPFFSKISYILESARLCVCDFDWVASSLWLIWFPCMSRWVEMVHFYLIRNKKYRLMEQAWFNSWTFFSLKLQSLENRNELPKQLRMLSQEPGGHGPSGHLHELSCRPFRPPWGPPAQGTLISRYEVSLWAAYIYTCYSWASYFYFCEFALGYLISMLFFFSCSLFKCKFSV